MNCYIMSAKEKKRVSGKESKTEKSLGELGEEDNVGLEAPN